MANDTSASRVMCYTNAEQETREKPTCRRCGPEYVIVREAHGRTMIQCAVCQWSVFADGYQEAKSQWEKVTAA